jgi:GNAT superfamily N-acetyltransferase
MRGVDLAIHPSYRRAGISVAIRSVMDFSEDFAFTWGNPNDHSRPGSVRSGRNEVGRLPRFVRPSWRLRDTLKRALTARSKTPPRLPIQAQSAAEVLRDDEQGSLARTLARTSAHGDRFATVKDLDYLRWRYGRFEEYRAVSVYPSGGGPGMAIFRTRRRGSFWMVDICELLVASNDRRTARRLLRQVRDAAPADLISCSFATARDAALCGFVRSRHGAALVTYELRPNVIPDPTQIESWALSVGDLELL